jgi:uncharacterized repeat protein (TIGR01451 family)
MKHSYRQTSHHPSTNHKNHKSKEDSMKSPGTILRTLTLAGAFLLVALWAPTAALANTAAGTVITNVATVTWEGGPAEGVSASAQVTVELKAAIPTLDFASNDPADLDSVPEGTLVTLTYTLTSNANGEDSYALAASFADHATIISTPTATVNGGSATISLGASVALSATVDGTSTIITLPADSSAHGITDTSIVIIGGTPFPVTGVNDGANTITITGTPAVGAGTPIQERKEFTVTFATGTLLGANTAGIHTVTTTATGTAGPASGVQTVTVTKATLNISKSANPISAQPGGTVTFTITVENTGAAAASSIEITDSIPAFTTFAGNVSTTPAGVVEYSDDDGDTWSDSRPATVTDIRVIYGSLDPAGSITFEFDVTID